jgi:hypothetical protein
LFNQLKKDWQRFKDAKPGDRFEEQYRVRHRRRTSPAARIASIGLGILLTAAGFVALVAPGPGILISGLGIALLARESQSLARHMDEFELLLRRIFLWAKRVWKNASTVGRVAIVTGALIVAVAGAWAAYKVMIDKG